MPGTTMQVRRKSEFQGTILIADDHEIYRLGLHEFFAEVFERGADFFRPLVSRRSWNT